ncbi:PP2C-family Ser/Thr phosphatase [Thiorhodovibrio winogradskyi]|uniref:PP2C-family Ser/Thr phosphatase n=1 Tax=Thiorhodovibrio winogradskyi TaxID=77007 RepID=A0ABZ0SCR2_9GAMM|nr:protein phosphatase 2C domain-containing protein [Thiorhodovibrio winogradskyi]
MTRLRFRTAQLSAAGGRQVNEDAIAQGAGCWALADGLGGHGGGEVAARLAVDAALAALKDRQPEPQALNEAIAAAHQAVVNSQQDAPRLVGMRTTLVLLVSDGQHAAWAHVGDSRLYGFRAGKLWMQTADHSVPQVLALAGEITPEQIRGHEDRNRLLRCLGQERPPKPALNPEPNQDPIALQPGDVFLLCSDGFWEGIDEARMQLSLAQATDPGAWLATLEQHLLAQAEPGHDNYSALAIFVDGPAP